MAAASFARIRKASAPSGAPIPTHGKKLKTQDGLRRRRLNAAITIIFVQRARRVKPDPCRHVESGAVIRERRDLRYGQTGIRGGTGHRSRRFCSRPTNLLTAKRLKARSRLRASSTTSYSIPSVSRRQSRRSTRSSPNYRTTSIAARAAAGRSSMPARTGMASSGPGCIRPWSSWSASASPPALPHG